MLTFVGWLIYIDGGYFHFRAGDDYFVVENPAGVELKLECGKVYMVKYDQSMLEPMPTMRWMATIEGQLIWAKLSEG